MCHDAVLWEQAARSQRQRQRQGIGSSSDAGAPLWRGARGSGSGKAFALVPMQVGWLAVLWEQAPLHAAPFPAAAARHWL